LDGFSNLKFLTSIVKKINRVSLKIGKVFFKSKVIDRHREENKQGVSDNRLGIFKYKKLLIRK
jgi:hypothetical protein